MVGLSDLLLAINEIRPIIRNMNSNCRERNQIAQNFQLLEVFNINPCSGAQFLGACTLSKFSFPYKYLSAKIMQFKSA